MVVRSTVDVSIGAVVAEPSDGPTVEDFVLAGRICTDGARRPHEAALDGLRISVLTRLPFAFDITATGDGNGCGAAAAVLVIGVGVTCTTFDAVTVSTATGAGDVTFATAIGIVSSPGAGPAEGDGRIPISPETPLDALVE